jgi:hypothetical protein
MDKCVWVDAQKVINGGDEIARAYRVVDWVASFFVGGSKNGALFSSAAR